MILSIENGSRLHIVRTFLALSALQNNQEAFIIGILAAVNQFYSKLRANRFDAYLHIIFVDV